LADNSSTKGELEQVVGSAASKERTEEAASGVAEEAEEEEQTMTDGDAYSEAGDMPLEEAPSVDLEPEHPYAFDMLAGPPRAVQNEASIPSYIS